MEHACVITAATHFTGTTQMSTNGPLQLEKSSLNITHMQYTKSRNILQYRVSLQKKATPQGSILHHQSHGVHIQGFKLVTPNHPECTLPDAPVLIWAGQFTRTEQYSLTYLSFHLYPDYFCASCLVLHATYPLDVRSPHTEQCHADYRIDGVLRAHLLLDEALVALQHVLRRPRSSPASSESASCPPLLCTPCARRGRYYRLRP